MRPAELASEHGLSAQAIRNYEDAGALPAAQRSEGGHRRYTQIHAQALRAFVALRKGHGHQRALEVMALINTVPANRDAALALLDETHADLLAERATRREVAEALAHLVDDALPPATTGVTIGALAHRLRVHPATLRTWERRGLLSPERDARTGYRLYSSVTVRDAEIAQQLRRGGYGLDAISRFLQALRATPFMAAVPVGAPPSSKPGGTRPRKPADSSEPFNPHAGFLDAWEVRIARRARSLLVGAAALDRYLDMIDHQHRAVAEP